MTSPALIERITRSLAYMLRHQPEEFGLRLDPHGWGEAQDVLRALAERLEEPVELADLETAIQSGDRPRYELQGGRIRALYGHSIDVLPGEPSRPPELLYVGLERRDAERAVASGLRGGRRRFLHLARTVEDAREAGRRAGRQYAILTVYALDAWEEGVNFYDRQALFLAEQVPTEYLEITETGSDGYDAPPRGAFHRPSRGPSHEEASPQSAREEPAREERPHAAPREARAGREEHAPRAEPARGPRASERGGRGRDVHPGSAGHPRHHGDGPRREDRPASHRSERHPERHSRGPAPRGGEGARRGERRDRGEGAPHAPAREPARTSSAPAAPAVRPPAPSSREPSPGRDFGLGVFEEPSAPPTPEPARPPRPRPVEPPAPPPRAPADPESGGFGAGV